MQNYNNYPMVLVHGFAGWGEKDLLSKIAPYWGMFSGNASKIYKKEGIPCAVPAVGPFTSAWDRACELWAQLTGTTVDYGKAHSEKYGHARYGRTYKKPMIPDWGKKNSKGEINKINIIGHSYGGPTVTIFINLLVKGSEEERAVTPEKELSELFKGGHDNWVHACISLAASHNGTDLIEAANALHLTPVIENALFSLVSILGTSPLMKLWDQHFEHYGLSVNYKFPQKIEFNRKKENIENLMAHPGDVSLVNLSVEETIKMHKELDLKLFDNIYYFSYAGQKNHKIPILGKFVPDDGMFIAFKPFSLIMGVYKPFKPGRVINKKWYANDGMVNTVSAIAPLSHEKTDYDPNCVKPGIWNVMPIVPIDHNAFVGLNRPKGDFKASMLEYAKLAGSCPTIDK